MFWADEIAELVTTRRPNKSVYKVHDYKTPSGRVHVGALCGVAIHDAIAKALVARGEKVEYTYGFDDFDPMDGFPVYLPEEFRQYMGMPLCNVPSPEPGYDSFAQHYGQEFVRVFNKLGLKPKIIWMSEFYKSGQFNEAIRTVLDKADIIRQVYKELNAEKPGEWYALNVVCPTCHKIGTTRVTAWDGQQVSFTCEPAMVKWAEGCGHQGQISPFDGNAKMSWKVEWAAKWQLFSEDVETAGKDHMTKNGSFDTAAAVCRQVFGIEPPLGREFPYEWLLIGGKKMSSSKGIGHSAKEVAETLPPHLLNFFLLKGKPNRQREFSTEGNAIPLLYDEYDKAIAAYYEDPDLDIVKAISYSKTTDQTLPHYTMRFTKVAFLSQIPNADLWQVAAQEKGDILAPEEVAELEERLTYAKQWLHDYAPEEVKFTLQETLPTINLSETQKSFLRSVREAIEAGVGDGTTLHERIHQLKTDLELPAKDAFGAIYQIFLAKDSGPQAGWFLAALDRDFVLKRLAEAAA
jgi:lysyl-tRNA synthetase class 1